MSQRRMFSADIVNSDAFLEMPPSTQALYFHLGMRADDDGFVNPKMIMRMIGSSNDELKVLIGKRFLLHFESGVVVVKHWLIHNLIRADLYKETLYKKEKSLLGLNENGAYTELRDGVSELKQIEPPEWLKRRKKEVRTACVPFAVPRIGKVRLGKDSLVKGQTQPENITKTVDELWTEMIRPYEQQYAPSLIKDFTIHFRQKNSSGKKELWQMEKVFDMNMRLQAWQRRQEKWDFQRQTKMNKSQTEEKKPEEIKRNVEPRVSSGLQKLNFNI